MKLTAAVLFTALSLIPAARADLSREFDQRDPVLQAKIREYDRRLDQNTDATSKAVQRAAHSDFAHTEDSFDCTVDGSEPQVCWYRMANGLICQTKTTDNRLVAKVRCY